MTEDQAQQIIQLLTKITELLAPRVTTISLHSETAHAGFPPSAKCQDLPDGYTSRVVESDVSRWTGTILKDGVSVVGYSGNSLYATCEGLRKKFDEWLKEQSSDVLPL